MHRKSRIQAERDAAATNRAADSAALGTMAASMVLGVLLPHEMNATSDHKATSDHVADSSPSEKAAPQSPFASRADHSNQPSPSLHPSDARDFFDSHHIAVLPSRDDHAADTAALSQAHLDTAASHEAGSETSSTSLGDLTNAVPTADHLTNGHNAQLANWVDSAGAANAVGSDVNSTFDSVFSSISQSVMHAVDHLSTTLSGVSTTLSGMTSGLTASLTADLGSASDPLLHQPASALDALHLPDLPLLPAETSSITMNPPISLSSPTPAILGTPDGGMSQTFGAPETLAFLHPSALSFGDASNPIHIGFVGQALAPIDGHDSIPHANGSILHGFV